MTRSTLLFALLGCLSGVAIAENSQSTGESKDVTNLNMADLLKVQVTSASKKAQALSDAPSAIFVISNEDIRRSGATNIPEALRLAPGLNVARINSNKWAISSRGFNGSVANKLLVLIDGRSVYTPAFSGVYWDAQDVMLEDVDRIEVIRGPGATLWGANAVNGVINIMTKSADKTQNGLVSAGGGTVESGFGALRYGSQIGADTYARAYAKGFQRDDFKTLGGASGAGDRWSRQQGGFRIDSHFTDQDELTLQGDLYHTDVNQTLLVPTFTTPTFSQLRSDEGYNEGWNITSRLRHKMSTTSEFTLQVFYDHTRRNEYIVEQSLDTVDVDFQHNFELNDDQNVIWGLGYRANLDEFSSTFTTRLTPPSRNTQLFTAFVSDEFSLIDDTLWLTIGSKFEHNDFTGFEGQPTARLLWAPEQNQRVWAAFSRSVRTPARAEHDVSVLRAIVPTPPIPQLGGLSLPAQISVNGNRNFQSEVELSYELGYRYAFSQRASIDITGFYNEYDKLRGVSPGTFTLEPISGQPLPFAASIPTTFNNAGRAKTFGVEASAVWQMTDWWRWDANYSYLRTNQNTNVTGIDSVSPEHMASLRALVTPADDVNFDLWLKYNGSATVIPSRLLTQANSFNVKGYLSLDARLAWKPIPSVELSVVGQNLLAGRHLEYLDEVFAIPTEIPRSVYGKVEVEF